MSIREPCFHPAAANWLALLGLQRHSAGYSRKLITSNERRLDLIIVCHFTVMMFGRLLRTVVTIITGPGLQQGWRAQRCWTEHAPTLPSAGGD
jgi:hypothetical protein